jgi:erythromycin esterase-like protein
VLIEADVPAAAALNAYVRSHPPHDAPGATAADAAAALRARFPAWMWSNVETLAFADRLRALNAARPPAARVGVYGMDVYSLHASAAAVVAHLEAGGHADAARAARRRYDCVTQHGDDAVDYAYALAAGARACGADVVAALVDVARRASAAPPAGPPGSPADEAALAALLNARAVASGEAYYRAMVFGGESTWNLRDAAFADAVALIAKKVAADRGGGDGRPPRLILWAHNSHLGDATATSMWTQRRETNVGALLKQAHGGRVLAVGCLTAGGTVAAASSWGGRVRQRALRPAPRGSYEALLHAVAADARRPSFALDLRSSDSPAARALAAPRLERAVGVQYKPRTERASHMFAARLPAQFGMVVFWDETRAVAPVPAQEGWEAVVGYDEASDKESD